MEETSLAEKAPSSFFSLDRQIFDIAKRGLEKCEK